MLVRVARVKRSAMRSMTAVSRVAVAGIGRGKGEYGGAVAQFAAIVHIAEPRRPRRPRCERGVISHRGAYGVAILRECRGHLGFGQLGGQPRQLRIVEVAQGVEVVGFGARQHIMGIGYRRQFSNLGVILADIIVQPGDRRFNRVIGHVLAVLFGPDQKIGGIGVEPRHGVAAVAPHAEAAVRTLQLDHVADRTVQRSRCRRTRIGMPQPRDVLDIEQRQRAARRLL